ncbi:hypothetical protein, partial [Parabacteroides sp.]
SGVSNCYNTGTVLGSDLGSEHYVGGIAGCLEDRGSQFKLSNCYFLSSGLGGIGGGEGDISNVESKTAAEFASGEVADLLGEEWAQAIGGDDFPVLMSSLSKEEKDAKTIYTVTFIYPEQAEQPNGDKKRSINIVMWENTGLRIS